MTYAEQQGYDATHYVQVSTLIVSAVCSVTRFVRLSNGEMISSLPCSKCFSNSGSTFSFSPLASAKIIEILHFFSG